jgi:hypothetical protein
MFKFIRQALPVVCILQHAAGFSQDSLFRSQVTAAQLMLKSRGEVVIEFRIPSSFNASYFAEFMSIDRCWQDSIRVYANAAAFKKFTSLNIGFKVLMPPSMQKSLNPFHPKYAGLIDYYPGYVEYKTIMQHYAEMHPDLCRLVTIGKTPNNHEILALKISDNPDHDEREPVVLLTSSMHGDEVLGYILLIRLVDELLAGYLNNSHIRHLIDNLEIWINPLANPDGTFFLSDTSVYGAIRFNANHVDLNRNFPDPGLGDHPDGNPWQAETIAMMHFMEQIHVVLAANFHGGSEVVNYPWDTWERLHADDAWYRSISRAYADSVHAHAPPGYFADEEDGITNGFSWYRITGGRQDYVNYYLNGREVTIELAADKMPKESRLDDFWEYHKRSLTGYIEQALQGVSGVVTDSVTGQFLKTCISMPDHDFDHSYVFSDSANGGFCRLLKEDYYTLVLHAPGYQEKQLNVNVSHGLLTHINTALLPFSDDFIVFPNPFSDLLNVYVPDAGGDLVVVFIDLTGRKVGTFTQAVTSAGIQEVRVRGIPPGLYVVQLTHGNRVIRKMVLRKGN